MYNIVGLVTKCRTCKIPKLHFSAFWPSYRLLCPTALISGHLANQKVEIMSCDKMPNLGVVIQKNTETAFLKNRFLLLLKSYEMQVQFFGMLIDSRVRSSAISALLTIQKVKKTRHFMKFQIVIKILKLQCIIPKLHFRKSVFLFS